MNIWHYSDPHFMHGNIIGHCGRPYESSDEMNQDLCARYRDTVGEEDLVIWHGDVACRNGAKKVHPQYLSFLRSLPGQRWLILGNHDRKDIGPTQWWVYCGFTRVFARPFQLGNLWLSHHPCETNNLMAAAGRPNATPAGLVNVHGHSHSKTPLTWAGVDVGVDAWDFEPVDHATVVDLARDWLEASQ